MSSWKTSLSTERVRRSFSAAAEHYDALTDLQREIADELIVKLPDARRILDVGCGTGYLTGRLKDSYPQAKITGLDFAQGMIAKAQEYRRDIQWITGDAELLPFEDKDFDVIVSNAAYQWVLDLPKAFAQAQRVLSNEGTFAANLFGYHTCDELFEALQATGASKEELNRLPKIEDVQKYLTQAGFSNAQVESKMTQIQFKDLWELLNWLKAIGANGLTSGQFLGPRALQEANEYCLKNYPHSNGINITFEVISIYAKA